MIYIGVIIRFMQSPIILAVKEPDTDNETSPSRIIEKELVVTRCFWGNRFFKSEFSLRENINVKIEQLDGDSPVVFQKGVCVITQGDKTIRFGALLEWDELVELKQEILAMIGSAKADTVPQP